MHAINWMVFATDGRWAVVDRDGYEFGLYNVRETAQQLADVLNRDGYENRRRGDYQGRYADTADND